MHSSTSSTATITPTTAHQDRQRRGHKKNASSYSTSADLLPPTTTNTVPVPLDLLHLSSTPPHPRFSASISSLSDFPLPPLRNPARDFPRSPSSEAPEESLWMRKASSASTATAVNSTTSRATTPTPATDMSASSSHEMREMKPRSKWARKPSSCYSVSTYAPSTYYAESSTYAPSLYAASAYAPATPHWNTSFEMARPPVPKLGGGNDAEATTKKKKKNNNHHDDNSDPKESRKTYILPTFDFQHNHPPSTTTTINKLRNSLFGNPATAHKRRSSIWRTEGIDEIPIRFSSDEEVLRPKSHLSSTYPAADGGPHPGSFFDADPSPPPLLMTRIQEILFIATICLAQLLSLAGLAQTVAPNVLLRDALGLAVGDAHPGAMGRVAWLTAAYSMTLGTFILPAGRLGDMFGHRRVFLLGWAWFAVMSAACGCTYLGGDRAAVLLSAARGLQGIGPALLVPNGIALMGRTFAVGSQRATAIAVFGGCGPVGFAVGALMAAALAQGAWWPWVFWAMAVACVAAGALAWAVIPEDALQPLPQEEAAKSKLEQFDVTGTVTGVSGLILINFVLNQAPVVGWSTAYIPALLVLGVLLMVVFVYVELYVAERPVVPLKGLHRDAALTLACIAAGWGSHGIWSYYLFLLLEWVRDETPVMAAAHTCLVAPVGFCAALAVPYLLQKMRVPWLMVIAMCVFTLSILLLVLAPAGQPYYFNTLLSIIIAPLAMNWSFPSGTILMSNAVSKQHQGIAASLVSTMVNYSIATGLGISGSIDKYTHPTAGLLGGFRNAWWFGISLGLLGVIISLVFVFQTRRR